MTYSSWKCRREAGWLGAAVGLSVIAAAVLFPPLTSPAGAQAYGMFGVAEADQATMRATVKSVDMKARTVTLVGPQGETRTLKVGDTITAVISETIAVAVEPAR